MSSGWYIICVIVLYLIVLNSFVEMCFPCRKYSDTYRPYMHRPKYLVRLPNSKKLNNLALIGTHSSLSYSIGVQRLQTQDLNIVQQLKYGIRVLDIGVRRQSNLFKIYAGYVFIEITFTNLLEQLDKFLGENPGELIIMFLSELHSPTYDVTKNNCHIIDYYINYVKGGKRLVKNWQHNDPIGMHRGKVLLASENELFSECTFNTKKHCLLQSVKVISFGTKYAYLLPPLPDIFLPRNAYSHFKCSIHNIALDDGVNDRRTIARDGGHSFKGICLEPINLIMTQNLKTFPPALSIVIADYATQELMDKINDRNFPNTSWRSGW